jgi:hypothetical protein
LKPVGEERLAAADVLRLMPKNENREDRSLGRPVLPKVSLVTWR